MHNTHSQAQEFSLALRNSDSWSVSRAVLWHFCEISTEDVLRDALTKIHSSGKEKAPKRTSKTQSRRVKQRKKETLTNVVRLYEQNSCKPVSMVQLLEKINNTRRSLRKNADVHTTGPELTNCYHKFLPQGVSTIQKEREIKETHLCLKNVNINTAGLPYEPRNAIPCVSNPTEEKFSVSASEFLTVVWMTDVCWKLNPVTF